VGFAGLPALAEVDLLALADFVALPGLPGLPALTLVDIVVGFALPGLPALAVVEEAEPPIGRPPRPGRPVGTTTGREREALATMVGSMMVTPDS